MKRFLMTLAFLLPLNTSALTPGEVQAIVQQAQESVQSLPQTQEEDIAIGGCRLRFPCPVPHC